MRLNFLKYHRDIFGFSKIKFWNKFFVSIFAIIIWLCLLSIFSTVMLEKILNPLKFSAPNAAIVEIHPENTVEKTRMKTEVVLDFLKTQSYVDNFEKLDEEKVLSLINNFTGQNEKLLDIPLPVLILVQIKPPYEDGLQSLKLGLSQKVNNIYLDTETELLKRFLDPISITKYISMLVPILALVLLSTTLFLIIYAILFSNKSFLNTLVLLGIYKTTLYKELAKWLFVNSAKSCFIATLLFLITILIIYIFKIASLEMLFLYWDFIIYFLLLIPFLTAILGVIFLKRLTKKYFYEE
ncbi:MAG: hypothetical protein LBQ34_06195 [Alphaproteobacteria bacterium]|jgi:hypothetical protein|nr:hypothetical protein [Alphaproteobacteria bacterium]